MTSDFGSREKSFVELSRLWNLDFLKSYKDLLSSFCYKIIMMVSGVSPRIIWKKYEQMTKCMF